MELEIPIYEYEERFIVCSYEENANGKIKKYSISDHLKTYSEAETFIRENGKGSMYCIDKVFMKKLQTFKTVS